MSKDSERREAEREATLIEKARDGDPEAMDQLLAAHQDRVYRTALGYLADEDAAQEVAQQTLIAAFRKLDSFRGDARLATWLYRMTINYAKNHQVSAGRQRSRFQSMDHSGRQDDSSEYVPQYRDTAPDPREQAAAKEASGEVFDQIAQLPEEYRSALLLRYVEDMSYEEIAESLEIAPGTVKSRINRGRKMLREAMAGRIAEGGQPQ